MRKQHLNLVLILTVLTPLLLKQWGCTFLSLYIMTINIQCKIINEIPILALYSNYKEGIITFDELKEQGRQYGAVITAS